MVSQVLRTPMSNGFTTKLIEQLRTTEEARLADEERNRHTPKIRHRSSDHRSSDHRSFAWQWLRNKLQSGLMIASALLLHYTTSLNIYICLSISLAASIVLIIYRYRRASN